MGEYADLQIQQDIKDQFGFDPGDMSESSDRKPKIRKPKTKCPICGNKFVGLADHQRDYHKGNKNG